MLGGLPSSPPSPDPRRTPCMAENQEKDRMGSRVLQAWSLAFSGALSTPPTEQCLPSVK